MLDYVNCKIDAIGYNVLKKHFTITINVDHNSTKCVLRDGIISFAKDFYEENVVCIATIATIKKKLTVTNIRRLGEEE